MATQTGSIDLAATNGVHLYAKGGFDNAAETYATQADLEVQADRIGMVIANEDASSSLQLTANAMTYIGNHVEIKGTDGTTTAISGGKIQANSIAIGALDSSTQTKVNNGDEAAGKLTTTLVPLTGSIGNVSGTYYLEICKSTIACNSNSASGAINISGTIGGYVNTNQGRVDVTIGTRGIPPYAIVGQRDSTIDMTRGNIVAYYDSNYIVHVYLVMSATYSKYVLDLNNASQFSRVNTTTTTAPSGTKFFDLSTASTEDSRTATNYITADETGIQVHNSGDTSDYVQITGNGMDVYNDGVNVARFGSGGARIGETNSSHITLGEDNLSLTNQDGATMFDVDMDAGTLYTTIWSDDAFGYMSRRVTNTGANGMSVSATSGEIKNISSGDTFTVPALSRVVQFTFIVSSASISSGCDTSGVSVTGLQYELARGGTFGTNILTLKTASDISFTYGTSAEVTLTANGFDFYVSGVTGGAVNVTVNVTVKISYGGGDKFSTRVTIDYNASSSASTISADLVLYGYAPKSRHTNTTTGAALTFGTRRDGETNGLLSSTFGEELIASNTNQAVFGKYNVKDTNDEYALIVGNGTADDARSNALAVTRNGHIDYGTSGDHYFVFKNTNASQSSITHWRITMTGYGNIRLDSSSDGGSTWTNGVKYFADENRTWPVANGGTGATSAAGARTNLGLKGLATKDNVAFATTTKTTTSSKASCSGGSSVTFSLSGNTAPSGYAISTGTAGFTSNHNSACVLNMLDGDNVKLRNVGSSALTDLTATLYWKWAKGTLS